MGGMEKLFFELKADVDVLIVRLVEAILVPLDEGLVLRACRAVLS